MDPLCGSPLWIPFVDSLCGLPPPPPRRGRYLLIPPPHDISIPVGGASNGTPTVHFSIRITKSYVSNRSSRDPGPPRYYFGAENLHQDCILGNSHFRNSLGIEFPLGETAIPATSEFQLFLELRFLVTFSQSERLFRGDQNPDLGVARIDVLQLENFNPGHFRGSRLVHFANSLNFGIRNVPGLTFSNRKTSIPGHFGFRNLKCSQNGPAATPESGPD